jgi:hypothetical protein
LAVFVKRYRNRLNPKVLQNEGHQNQQYLSTDEPNLDEFTVMVDDRVSKEPAAYLREIFNRRR